MKIVYKEFKKTVIPKLTIFITLFLIISIAHFYINLGNLKETENNLDNYEGLLFTQAPVNDTTVPIITFIQPSDNFTIINRNSYTFIVNISDDNLPSYGNVTIQISNNTNVLFNALMNQEGGSLWNFNWNNISLYPNYNIYKIKVWAKDSSPNENYSWSVYFYLTVSISTGPPILNVVLYIIAVSFIFAAIMVYINRKWRFRAS